MSAKHIKMAMLERRNTIRYDGMEGKFVSQHSFLGKAIGVFTSGGDSQGMNSAVRAVVRMGIYVGAKVYLIKEGYQGMVDGQENIIEATWASVSGIMQKGGTVIGSARCMDFKERTGRLKAAENLVKKGISNLVAIGGDGSLTGANLFKNEWDSLLADLLKEGRITKEEAEKCNYLNIIGLVGSIDNDFCGTDMTIGTDSALHRIIEATDCITVTAQSHQRCFIMEVMGRHCGYLALVASLASEADWVFIPEMPPNEGWQEHLCRKLSQNRSSGQRINIIIIAEGAIDSECKPISAEYVKNLIIDRLKLDTRITVLGHVQRGGRPSAFDRNLGLRMGAEAVLALMDADADRSLPACVVSIEGNQTIRLPLMHCVEKTRAVAKAMENKDFEEAVRLRGKSFMNNLQTFMAISKINPPHTVSNLNQEDKHSICIINVGAPACGVNATMRSFVRIGITHGYRILGVQEGFLGLTKDYVKEISWNDVRGWVGLGGSALGTIRKLPLEVGIDKVAKRLAQHKIKAVLLIGGFECFECMLQISEKRDAFPEFCIPMIMIPSTISNNIPGTEFSLGTDTALNEITSIIDKIKQSAMGTKRRVFVVETMGGNCGYLATLSGLAGGADAAYIFEEKFSIDDLRKDVEHMKAKIADNVQRGLVLRCENASANYTSQFVHQLYLEEGDGIFDCRLNVLGHMQQGGVPSPFDRNFGTKLGAKAIDWIHKQLETCKTEDGCFHTKSPETLVLMGLCRRGTVTTPVEELRQESDFKNRLPLSQWWMNLRPLLRIMSKHESLYESESIFINTDKSSN